MSDDRRLFGLAWSDVMQLDLDTVADQLWDDDDTERFVTIEEWSVTDSRSLLPKSDLILDDLVERCNSEGDEDWYEKLEQAAASPDVVAAFEQAINLLASKLHYWMADKKVAEHRIKLSPDGWEVAP